MRKKVELAMRDASREWCITLSFGFPSCFSSLSISTDLGKSGEVRFGLVGLALFMELGCVVGSVFYGKIWTEK